MWSRVPAQRRCRAIRRSVGRVLFPVVEAVWTAAFALTARIRPLEEVTAVWRARGTDHVVIVAPHPDDETIGAGGVAVLHRRAGDQVRVVVVTDGSASRAGGLAGGEMARRRADEIRAACVVLGLREPIVLGLREGGWETSEAGARLAALLRDATIVYAPSCVDFHPEHLSVARAVAASVGPGQTVRAYQIGVPLTSRLVNLVADIGPVASVKQRALRCLATQADALAPLERLARYHARRFRLDAAELFWEMPGAVYAQIMRRAGRDGSSEFRGVRQIPVTDPLAWWAGRRARTALRRIADQHRDSLSSQPAVSR